MKRYSDDFEQEVSHVVWTEKYRLKGVDTCLDDMYRRVIQGVYKNDGYVDGALMEDQPAHILEAYNLMVRKILLPAGRILAGAGTDGDTTLLNCFVCRTVDDSMKGIMHGLADTAVTMSCGGGMGVSFSSLRPNGALVRGKRTHSSGVIPFLEMWQGMSSTVRSAGERRGAMMGTLRVDHPDVIDFITVKTKPGVLTGFNLSVLLTDAFMTAVEAQADWDLGFGIPRADGNHVEVQKAADGSSWYVYKRMPAKELYELIMRTTYEYAEPGVIFIDTVNKQNPLYFIEKIEATNPCSEIPLPPHGACCLGSVNLMALVDDETGKFDFPTLERAVACMGRLLDNVLGVTRYPLVEQEVEGRTKRRIGIGITGLADALLKLGIFYGSSVSIDLVERIMRTIRDTAYASSAELAALRGCCEVLESTEAREKYLVGPFIRELPEETKNLIRHHGIRNSVLLTIAPTGTTSLVADNVSSGIEPVFAFEYDRKIIRDNGTTTVERVYDQAYYQFRQRFGTEYPVPKHFVCSEDITPDEHIAVQAACQKYIDSSISKTINVPESIPFEEFSHIYQMAWEKGLKGCTTYRPSGVRGSVLTKVDDTKVEEKVVQQLAPQQPVRTTYTRPDKLSGHTYKLRWPGKDEAYYLTINHDENRIPREIFISSKSAESDMWIKAQCLVLSALMRKVSDITFMLREFQGIVDPFGGKYVDGVYYKSFISMLGHKIEEHILSLQITTTEEVKKTFISDPGRYGFCSYCENYSLKKEQGCEECLNCGHSKCQ